MIGAGGVAERGPDPAVVLGDEVLLAERAGLQAALATNALVQELGEGLREAVGDAVPIEQGKLVEVRKVRRVGGRSLWRGALGHGPVIVPAVRDACPAEPEFQSTIRPD